MDYYSFNRPRGDGWLSWPCWLTDSGHFTHKVVTRPADSLTQDRESSPARTGSLTTMLCHAARSLWVQAVGGGLSGLAPEFQWRERVRGDYTLGAIQIHAFTFTLYLVSACEQRELRDEDRRYREYLRQVRDEERRREKEMELICDAEVEKMWDRRVRQWQIEKMARQKLLEEVLASRRQQIQQKCMSSLVLLIFVFPSLFLCLCLHPSVRYRPASPKVRYSEGPCTIPKVRCVRGYNCLRFMGRLGSGASWVV